MGVVWEAFDEALRRPVALKLMTPHTIASVEARRRFEREAMTIAQLRNEHIVQVYDYGVDDGSPYIVMELLDGEDLDARLQPDRQLSSAALLPLLRQVAKALEAAHAEGIVHCDLKPANIFLARSGSGETVKLLDFGVAWTLCDGPDAPERPCGTLLGTPAYMSPEQVRGVAPHFLSDLWSFGVIAYRALTGRLPFPSENIQELIIGVCTDPFLPPSSVVPELRSDVDRFFERALAKDRTQRFQSARGLVAAFSALCREAKVPVKILVVDDEPDIHLLMKLQFRQQLRDGVYELVFAEHGERALEELRRNPDIDIVLTDINMPVMDGLTLLGHIPEVNPMAKTVIVSAYGDMANIRHAMNQGAFDFLFKPIDFEDLEATIQKTIRHVAEQRKNARSDEENALLRRFTSASLVERVRALGPSAALASEASDATVAVVGVFQFTPVTTARPAGEAIRLLNANFEVILPELVTREGMVDKFFGDAVMTVYRGPDHVDRALAACLAVRTQLAALVQRAGAGSPYAQGVCIGLATGRVLSAGVGSQACGQLDYATVGEAVDIAAHLARAALPGEILADARVREAAVGGYAFELVDARDVWPRGERTTVYNVHRHEPPAPRLVDAPTVQVRSYQPNDPSLAWAERAT
ncbi:protein kinase domain-containing protein [Sorangium cellulosum]